jgi:hypothetical protein
MSAWRQILSVADRFAGDGTGSSRAQAVAS